MGQDISTALNPPPLTLTHCIVDGNINIGRYCIYKRRQALHDKCVVMRHNKRRSHSEDTLLPDKKRVKTHRSIKRYKVLVRENDGCLREIRPEDTLWYLLYVKHPPLNDRLIRQFRRRFRIPYEAFLNLSADIKNDIGFAQWLRSDAVGDRPMDIKLLLLGCLRYIGRAWTYDDIYEANGISISTNRQFIFCLINYGSTVLYKKWVIDSRISRNLNEQESLFRQGGFNGCIGSSDATHVPMLKCSQWASNNHKGFKLNVPARTYNVTVDHSRRILQSTSGHPGTWNDKTLILFDEYISGVHAGIIHNDFIFHLYEKDDNDEIIEVAYKGVWFMVDNGYLSWSCTVPPSANGTTYEIIRFSEWLESVRKDVECTFGIMKGRFAILRYGLRFQSITRCDQMFLTCCALHNLLLDHDGLQNNWNEYYDYDTNEITFAMSRLNQPTAAPQTIHPDNSDIVSEIRERRNHVSLCRKYTKDNCRVVNKMPLELFKQCLVNHFDIRFQKNDIKWPSRNHD